MPIPTQPRRAGPPRRRPPKSPGASQTDLTSDAQSPPAEGEGELGATPVSALERAEPKAEPEREEEVEETEVRAQTLSEELTSRLFPSSAIGRRV